MQEADHATVLAGIHCHWGHFGMRIHKSIRPDSPDASFREANDFLAKRRVTVELADGSRLRRMYASIAPDYIWIGPNRDLMEPHAWSTVLKVSSGKGFSGVFFGFVMGLSIPGIPLAALGASGCDGGLECIGPSAGGAAAGLFAGGLLGSIVIGAGKDQFVFLSENRSTLRTDWRLSSVSMR